MRIDQKIRRLAAAHAEKLQSRIDERVLDMEEDDSSHYLIYQVLGITVKEGKQIDVYQNVGRFLYYRAGAFLEKAASLCFKERFPDAASRRIPNTRGQRPRTFEIDCLVGETAVEIKWRDATTDGDHINKEHARVKVISEAGYKPVRVMFFYPNRSQAIRIQETLETIYKGVGGEYYHGDAAWDYITQVTGVDLLSILKAIAEENAKERPTKE